MGSGGGGRVMLLWETYYFKISSRQDPRWGGTSPSSIAPNMDKRLSPLEDKLNNKQWQHPSQPKRWP